MDIIDEVAEEVQNEKLLNLWRKSSVFVYSFLGCVIIGTALYAFWKDRQEKEREKASTLYARALRLEELKKIDEAEKTFEKVISAKVEGFKSLAELSLSDMLGSISKQNTQERTPSLKFLEELGASSEAPKVLRKIAMVKLLLLESNAKEDSSLKEKLDTLLEQKENAWSPLIKEVKAALEYQNGNLEKAYGIYEALLKNPKSSSGVRHRAMRMVMLLKSQGADTSHGSKELQELVPEKEGATS